MLSTFIVGLLLSATPASARSCTSQLSRAKSARGDALARAFDELCRCDIGIAEANFNGVLVRAKDVDTIVALSLTAIRWKVWNPVWRLLSHPTLEYEVRDEIAAQVGSSCIDESGVENQTIISFLQGGYYGLRDIEFKQWDDAFIACESPTLMNWVQSQVESPPDKMFDEKYSAVVDIYVQRKRDAALPYLAKGAIAAANSGPFDTMLSAMDSAVTPALGGLGPEEQKKLEDALVQVAQAVNPDKARAVADRLANAGSQAAAAQLLTRVYPDRVQGDGSFLYGAAAIELGKCNDEKRAIIHRAQVLEPGTRWIILTDIREPMQSVKPKLSNKCTSEGDWPVSTTPEPVANSKAVDAWVDTLETRWKEKGYDVSVKNEKTIRLSAAP